MEIKINKDYYDKYVEIYNTQGSTAAKNYVVCECNLGYDLFQRKMRREADYIFNKGSKRYERTTENEQSLSLDKLCGTKKPSSMVKSNPNEYNVKVDDLIAELMRDRLIEIQTFIRLERD